MDGSPLTVLLVEDDEVFVVCMRRALKKAELNVHLEVAGDGVEALRLLRGDDGQPPLPKPHVLFLDINMPRMDGHSLLRELRSDEALRDRVVFMLSTSKSEQDRAEAYSRQVAGYIDKGREGTNLPTVMGLIEKYRSGIEFPV